MRYRVVEEEEGKEQEEEKDEESIHEARDFTAALSDASRSEKSSVGAEPSPLYRRALGLGRKVAGEDNWGNRRRRGEGGGGRKGGS